MSYATEPNYLKDGKENRLTLTLAHVRRGMELRIIDNQGILLHKETIETTGLYSRSFDLSNLPNGTYSFQMDMDTKYRIMPFEIQNGILDIEEKDEYFIYKPTIYQRENRLYISKFSTVPVRMNIIIYNSRNETIYTEAIYKDQSIGRIYDLSKLEKGAYTIIMNTQNKTYTERIIL